MFTLGHNVPEEDTQHVKNLTGEKIGLTPLKRPRANEPKGYWVDPSSSDVSYNQNLVFGFWNCHGEVELVSQVAQGFSSFLLNL